MVTFWRGLILYPSHLSSATYPFFFHHKTVVQTPNINFSVSPRLESNFIDSYCVLFEFEKRMSVNMQEINLKFWIMGRTTEGAI